MNRLLLHACCGPCTIHVAEQLRGQYELSLFFCESNIDPYEEYARRLQSLRAVADLHGLQLYVSSYDYERWKSRISGTEDEPEGGARCEVCVFERLKETANSAARMKFNAFATTLTVSPHKDADMINSLGKRLADRAGVSYLESDFKKRNGFQISNQKSRTQGLYRQSYCGCEFSNRQASPRE